MDDAFKLETKSLWSFKERGEWATHKGNYPGNWSPFVPKNVILRYSKQNDVVLDQFLGSGTTLIEARLLNRRGIGCDVNPKALEIAKNRILKIETNTAIQLIKCNATNLECIKGNSIDLICTHPPYSNIIKYSKNIQGDLSLLNLNEFYEAIEEVSKECFRVLKKSRYCAIMMGDIRKNGYVIPLGFNIMNLFLNQGFRLKEIIIKEQHNCNSTKYWKEISLKKNFYLLSHEYLFIFFK
ncbi:DNA methylase N-4 [Clostridium botulinum A2B7 92]|uniref:TRM11 family SAM-dependent methyltransferase n=1 Tax=Clostridium botulinum TaxID=1491 RepID=UPI0007DFE52B|nr:DNA methyltransferase [Clostridium botulinum]KEJ01319.1 DNA methylase N-4 [Clostridium botulinum A2B7 92]